MEIFWYQCPVCGLKHQVPAYWMSFSPEPVCEFPHSNLTTREMCTCTELVYMPEE